MRNRNSNKRLFRIIQIMVLIGTLVSANVLFTMVTKTHIWSGTNVLDSRIQNSIVQTNVNAKRGTIYDRNDQIIAQQVQAYTIVAYVDKSNLDSDGNAYYVKDARKTAKKLKTVLKSMDVDDVVDIIHRAKQSGRTQTELGTGTKRLDESTMKKIKKLKLDGIDFVDTINRNYPNTPFASNLIGFATYDEDKQKIVGKLGLESSLNRYLQGKDGKITYQQNVSGDVLPGTTNVITQAEDGDNVQLTIDTNLQLTVESALKESMEDNDAENAWCLVMEPGTGKILAWASYPTYNQNKHAKIPSYTNLISESLYEPGSVMKPFTYATAIDSGVYPSKKKKFRAGTFNYAYDPTTHKITRTTDMSSGYPTISDALGEDFGTITFDQGLAYSSNVGICELLSKYINYKDYGKYVNKFKLYQQTGIPYVDEVTGNKNLDMPMGYLNSGFGQGSSVTILSLCQAYTSIFNDGKMMRPYVVETITDSATGEVVKSFKPTQVGRPISSKTAKKIRNQMSGVLESGASGERFAMDGVDMIAKTGTGEIYDTKTGEYKEKTFTSSVMAAAPEDSPKVMVYWGMVSDNYINYSAEPFQTIMKAALVAQGVSGADSNTSSSDSKYEKWESYQMPELMNHSVSYASDQLDEKKVHVYKIGNGENVMDQYPAAGTVINSNDRVFVVTDGNSLSMPNMKGWTRKDITAFSQLTGVKVNVSGTGKVKSQSVETDSAIAMDTKIEVKLE